MIEDYDNVDYDYFKEWDLEQAKIEIRRINKENRILKHRLNDIVFDDANDDVELGARFLRKIGYVDFDEERKVYINKHNKEPFWQEDEREKDYYIQDKELNEYTKQLEYKLQQKENIIKEVREFVERYLELNLEAFDTKGLLGKILEILEKESE